MSPRSTFLGSVLVVATAGLTQAQVLPGDTNCDSVMDGLDIGAFALALVDPSGYAGAYPGCPSDNADFDCDQAAGTGDVDGFVDCLLTGNCPPCGACCHTDGSCMLTPQMDCIGTWQGAATDCDPNPCSPPPAMVMIPAGEFTMGNCMDPGEGESDELPVHVVYIDAIYMDTYEVTNRQYADALNWASAQGNLIQVTDGRVYRYGGTNCSYCDTTTSSSYSQITWNGTTFGVASGKEDHPIVRVSWYGAAACANWRSGMQGKPLCYNIDTWECNFGSGYRLPTEAEWEKAARGGTPGHRFPWSDQDTIQHAGCSYNSSSSYSYDTSLTRGYHPCWSSGSPPYTSPVGFFTGALQQKADWGWPGSPTSYQTVNSANGYGLYDMAGNVYEWCNDRYSPTYYSSSPYNNPHGPTSGAYQVRRGGSWVIFPIDCRCAFRFYNSPGARNYDHGFRLVLDSE